MTYRRDSVYREWARNLAEYIRADVYKRFDMEVCDDLVSCIAMPRFRFRKTIKLLKTSPGHWWGSQILQEKGIEHFAVTYIGPREQEGPFSSPLYVRSARPISFVVELRTKAAL